jgi:sulfoquinovosyltransferase
MRSRLTNGNPDAPILIHVGRLGAEKNLFVLKDILQRLPGAHLAFVGDGPSREDLEEHFADMPNVKFMVSFLSTFHSFD